MAIALQSFFIEYPILLLEPKNYLGVLDFEDHLFGD